MILGDFLRFCFSVYALDGMSFADWREARNEQKHMACNDGGHFPTPENKTLLLKELDAYLSMIGNGVTFCF